MSLPLRIKHLSILIPPTMFLHQRQKRRIPQNLLILKFLDNIAQMHALQWNKRLDFLGRWQRNRRTRWPARGIIIVTVIVGGGEADFKFFGL